MGGPHCGADAAPMVCPGCMTARYCNLECKPQHRMGPARGPAPRALRRGALPVLLGEDRVDAGVRQLRRTRRGPELLGVLPRRRRQGPLLRRGVPATALAERDGPAQGNLPRDAEH